jgi:hypothetical protein
MIPGYDKHQFGDKLRASNKMGMDRVMPCVAFANK